MRPYGLKFTVLGTLLTIVVFVLFALWMLSSPATLFHASREDGPIEYLTSFLFGISAIGFLVMMARSEYLKQRKENWRYFFLICWVVLMFLFMGEEISWGQRIFDYGLPESVVRLNEQGEFNIHNLQFMHAKKYRALSIFILAVGILFPVFAATGWGRKLVQRLCFPVLPSAYSGFFVCSFVYGKVFYEYANTVDAATEVRELLVAVGMVCFAIHGIYRSSDLFRLDSTTEQT